MGNKQRKSATEKVINENSALDLPFLPVELWELLLSYCSRQTLAMVLPKVSKMCRKLWNDAWRIKFKRDYLDLKEQPFDENSWKDLYLGPHDFFPFLGFIIGRTTYKELADTKGAIIKPDVPNDDGTRFLKCVDVDDFNFDCESNNRQIFVRLQICHWLNSYIPLEWQKQGLTWYRSYNSYKALFKRSTGNYIVTKARSAAAAWTDGEVQLNTVIAQQLNEPIGTIYYKIVLKFGGRKDPSADQEKFDLDAEDTLDSIEFVTTPVNAPDYPGLVERYINKTIRDPDLE